MKHLFSVLFVWWIVFDPDYFGDIQLFAAFKDEDAAIKNATKKGVTVIIKVNEDNSLERYELILPPIGTLRKVEPESRKEKFKKAAEKAAGDVNVSTRSKINCGECSQ